MSSSSELERVRSSRTLSSILVGVRLTRLDVRGCDILRQDQRDVESEKETTKMYATDGKSSN